MQPSILSPVPTIAFVGGLLTVEAVYHSGTGAPMQQAEISVSTGRTAVVAATSASGESVTGTVKLSDIVASDAAWSLGNDLTIVAKTMEQGAWSETRYTAPTCGPPSVSIVSGAGKLYGFPQEINWTYGDYPGFYQERWKLTVTGSSLVGKVEIESYSATPSLSLEGPEVAYAAAVGGTAAKLTCVLEVWSTSGISASVSFDLVPTSYAVEAKPSASIADGRMLVECGKPFFLYALSDSFEQCAWSDDGYLNFALPTSGPRWFAVTLGENRIGRADEVHVSGTIGSAYIDYETDGIMKRVDVELDADASQSITSSIDYHTFAGRENPVGYSRGTSRNLSASCTLFNPQQAHEIADEISGAEAVFRAYNGGIWRVVVDSASNSANKARSASGNLSLSMTVVDGSPYALFYGSPFFRDAQLYPGVKTFPSNATWMVG